MSVEFRAFSAYARTVFRNNEADNNDPATGNPGRRCRVWSKSSPADSNDYDKTMTYILDLNAHPGTPPNFVNANAAQLRCDAPGYTAIGAGSTQGQAFSAGEDYVNRVYLTLAFWTGLPAAERPAFPPMAAVPIDGRLLAMGPQTYEFQSYVYATDDADVPRRSHRYIGYYAEVVSKVLGTVNTWNVRVFRWADSDSVLYQLDFGNPAKYAPQTTITAVIASRGALFLDSVEASGLGLSLPKLPAAQGFADIPAMLAVLPHDLVPTPELEKHFASRIPSS